MGFALCFHKSQLRCQWLFQQSVGPKIAAAHSVYLGHWTGQFLGFVLIAHSGLNLAFSS
jgi:hypothetical protein